MQSNQKTTFLSAWKETITTSAVVVASLSLFYFFPANGAIQEITSSLFFLFLIPFLYLKLILKKDLRNYGWQLGNWKKGIFYAAFSLLASLLIFYFLLNHTRFPQHYSLPGIVSQNFGFFLFYELILTGFFLTLYEFFFRGFVMFSFSSKLGLLSPFFQFLLFALFLFATGNFDWENTFYLTVAFFAGWTTYQSRSLLYSFAFGLFFIFIADALVIKLVR